jgi:hypothetical protein
MHVISTLVGTRVCVGQLLLSLLMDNDLLFGDC